MDPYDVISVLLEAVLNGTHLDADMPFDPVITVTPGRVVIDGRFGVISGDELRPIHVEIGIDSLRQAAESVSPESVGDYPPAVVAWGNLHTYLQDLLAHHAGPDPTARISVVLP